MAKVVDDDDEVDNVNGDDRGLTTVVLSETAEESDKTGFFKELHSCSVAPHDPSAPKHKIIIIVSLEPSLYSLVRSLSISNGQ